MSDIYSRGGEIRYPFRDCIHGYIGLVGYYCCSGIGTTVCFCPFTRSVDAVAGLTGELPSQLDAPDVVELARHGPLGDVLVGDPAMI